MTLVVSQHLDESRVRAIALQPTDGLYRGLAVSDSGATIRVPVGMPAWGACSIPCAVRSTAARTMRVASSCGAKPWPAMPSPTPVRPPSGACATTSSNCAANA